MIQPLEGRENGNNPVTGIRYTPWFITHNELLGEDSEIAYLGRL